MKQTLLLPSYSFPNIPQSWSRSAEILEERRVSVCPGSTNVCRWTMPPPLVPAPKRSSRLFGIQVAAPSYGVGVEQSEGSKPSTTGTVCLPNGGLMADGWAGFCPSPRKTFSLQTLPLHRKQTPQIFKTSWIFPSAVGHKDKKPTVHEKPHAEENTISRETKHL